MCELVLVQHEQLVPSYRLLALPSSGLVWFRRSSPLLSVAHLIPSIRIVPVTDYRFVSTVKLIRWDAVHYYYI